MDTRAKLPVSALKADVPEIRSPEDLMRFFDETVAYGCRHADGTRFENSLGGAAFREGYRTMSLEDTLREGLGACFEQANVAKFAYEALGIPHRTFCTRGFNAEHPHPGDLYLVHCFVLGRWGDEVLNVEHSDSEKRGVYRYRSMDEAVRETNAVFAGKFRLHGATETRLDEYEGYIPGGLSFLEFNRFVEENAPAASPPRR